MGAGDHITAEEAVTGSDVTVSIKLQDPDATRTSITEAKKPLTSKQSSITESNDGVLTQVVKDSPEDAMIQTTTQVGHLRLAGEQEPESSTVSINEEACQNHGNSHDVANSRCPSDINLHIHIKVRRSKTPVTTSSITVPASKCTNWNELRLEVIAAGWQIARVNSLKTAHFRLEEDGKAASLTIVPTRIDAYTAFPGKIYEGWYHRILRGRQSLYKVDVNIEI
ncbi:hypothetical protein H2200_000930 [Cladophialophora chaetospira]|uniref:Uncharacterized protein n=1 Tax=Cladophialophora chaetospira TaxID=386627 RepID=A0AA38XPH6_9EURO|nr:hypothetical protein H2200_000930 [Cladophialophora chaetospira]